MKNTTHFMLHIKSAVFWGATLRRQSLLITAIPKRILNLRMSNIILE